MKLDPMIQPKTRSEFEKRFFILAEKLRQEKYHMSTPGGLDKVRSLPNGRLDFLSVNEMARLQANSLSHFDSSAIRKLIDEQEKNDNSK